MTEFERIKAMDRLELALYINKLQLSAIDDYDNGFFPKGVFENISMLEKEVPDMLEASEIKPPLKDQIRAAGKEADSQCNDMTPIFIFEEDRSGDRLGKPGDPNNVYYASWFTFYAFDSDQNPRSEGSSLIFKDQITHKPVPGGNSISEVDIIEAFRKANPNRPIVVLCLESLKGDLKARMNQALESYRENGQALLMLPPLDAPRTQTEPTR